MLSSHSSFIVIWDKFDTRKWKCFQYKRTAFWKTKNIFANFFGHAVYYLAVVKTKLCSKKNTLDYREDRCKREMSLLVVSMSGTVKNVDSLIWTSGRISHFFKLSFGYPLFQVKTAMHCHSFVWLRACCQVNAGKTLSTLHINRFLFISSLRA